MKQFFFFLILSTLSFGCSPDDDELIIDGSIEGRWKWVSSVEGHHTKTVIYPIFAESRILEISTTTLKHYKNGDLVHEIDYEIKMEYSYRSGFVREVIFVDGFPEYSFILTKKHLRLLPECFDCGSIKYKKL